MSQPRQPRPGAVFSYDGRQRVVVAVRASASGGAPVVWHSAAAGRRHVEQMPLGEFAALSA